MIRPRHAVAATGVAAAMLLLQVQCKPPIGPVVDADAAPLVEASVGVVTDVCSILEGVTGSGAVYSVCATVEEIAAVIAYILTLRTGDAGAPAGKCANLPGTTFCATSAERAAGVQYVTRLRAARLLVDGGKP